MDWELGVRVFLHKVRGVHRGQREEEKSKEKRTKRRDTEYAEKRGGKIRREEKRMRIDRMKVRK
jgi:hypothetical protein